MLDACAELVDEVGCDGLTTTLLAERARVAIGSVYQFFPDKQAVVRALVVRNLEEYLGRLANRLASAAFRHWWEAVDAAIDEYIEMHRNVPGFRTLRFGDIGDRQLTDGQLDSATAIADQLVALLSDQLGASSQSEPSQSEPSQSEPEPSAAGQSEPRFALIVATEMSDALVTLAFRRDPDGDPQVLAECRALAKEYVARQLP
jgi:AcrR family transcriptional regulator